MNHCCTHETNMTLYINQLYFNKNKVCTKNRTSYIKKRHTTYLSEWLKSNTGNTRCWWRYEAIGTLIHCWWECKMVQPPWKTVWQLAVFYNSKHTLAIWSSNHALRYLPEGVENLCPPQNHHMDVYSSFIHKCQELGATKMSFNNWMNK